MFMIEITVIDVESKELYKMEERKKKKLKKKKLSTIRIVVISETCLLITRHKKKGYASRSIGILFLLYFVFAPKMSVAG